MRRAAKLLIECRKLYKVGTQQSFEDFITPDCVDTLIDASQKLSGSDGDYNMKTPSVAGKLKHDLRRLALAKELFAIKEGNKSKAKEATDFIKVIDKEWLIRIGITANAVAQERNFNKKADLPNPSDMNKLTTFIKNKLNETVYDMETPVWKTYVDVVSLVQARLVTYNKRRPGELETLTLEVYSEALNFDTDVSLMEQLTTLERRLVASQLMVTIRGKRGRPVPLLIPNDCRQPLDYLSNADVRASLGISRVVDNAGRVLFFASRGKSVFRVCDAVRTLANECHTESNFKHVTQLRCTQLRKYLATATQMLDLSDAELQWVVTHLGHTMDVHHTHYRCMESVIERAKVAKLLILCDNGKMNNFAGKKLEEITLDDVDLSMMLSDEEEEPLLQAATGAAGHKRSAIESSDEDGGPTVKNSTRVAGRKRGAIESSDEDGGPTVKNSTRAAERKRGAIESSDEDGGPTVNNSTKATGRKRGAIESSDEDGGPTVKNSTRAAGCKRGAIESSDEDGGPTVKNSTRGRERVRWSPDEEKNVARVFRDYIVKDCVPNKLEVEEARKMFKVEKLKQMHYRRIVFKVHNLITAKKRP